jgi:predicted small lipoprotein YifL
MKKILFLPMVLALSIIFVACGAKGPNTTKATNTTTSSSISNTKTAYTKEFSYLPAYSADMKALNTKPADKQGFITAYYAMKNMTGTNILQSYENILKKNGWTISQEQKTNDVVGFMAKKDNHQATIILLQKNKDVAMAIVSK